MYEEMTLFKLILDLAIQNEMTLVTSVKQGSFH